MARTVVAHPPEVKKIANARVRTDKRAVRDLAKLLSADLIPEVWVPPVPVRELRALISHRTRLVKMSTMTKNRLHSVVHRNNLIPPEGQLFGHKNRAWWQEQDLSPTEHLRVQQGLDTLAHLQSQIKSLNQELARLSNAEPWVSQAVYILQIPGFGLITTMTVLGAIGDISRFPTDKKLVGYSGLYPSVHDSGKTHRQGRITKRGRKELRWALVEAAWAAVRSDEYWKAQFERYKERMHANKAIVAIARRLLVIIWHVLTRREPYRHASDERIAATLMNWSWKLNEERRDGMKTRQFVRYHLMRLGIGEDLTSIERGAYQHRIAPAEEIQALYPGLGPPV